MKVFKQITSQQYILFIVATLMWISVKSGQFLMKTQASQLTTDAALIASVVGVSGLVGFIVRFPSVSLVIILNIKPLSSK